MKYQVQSQQDLINVILPHFAKYPLLSSKVLNFNDFKEGLFVNNLSIPVTGSVLGHITRLKAGMNKARSFEDKYNSVNVVELHPLWVLGFVDGEGTFYAYVEARKKTRNTTYVGVDLSIEIGQNSHDIKLLKSLSNFFNGGNLSPKCNIDDIADVTSIRRKSIFKLKLLLVIS
jgi:hypothetical protein